jgi:hypothetical protein
MLSVILFSVVMLAVVIGIIVALFKFIKNTPVKVILTIVTLIGGIIVWLVGISIIGFAALDGILQDSIEEAQIQAVERTPQNQNGEEKETFEINEVVTGNGFEVTINEEISFTDTLFDGAEPTEYCGVNLTVKHLDDYEYSFGTLDLAFRDDVNTTYAPDSLFFEEANEAEYGLKTFTLQQGDEATFNAPIQCDYNVTQFIVEDYKIDLATDETFDIIYNVNFND